MQNEIPYNSLDMIWPSSATGFPAIRRPMQCYIISCIQSLLYEAFPISVWQLEKTEGKVVHEKGLSANIIFHIVPSAVGIVNINLRAFSFPLFSNISIGFLQRVRQRTGQIYKPTEFYPWILIMFSFLAQLGWKSYWGPGRGIKYTKSDIKSNFGRWVLLNVHV